MGLFCFAVVWCLCAPLYMSCVFRGSFVSSLFWFFIKLFFIDQKKKYDDSPEIKRWKAEGAWLFSHLPTNATISLTYFIFLGS